MPIGDKKPKAEKVQAVAELKDLLNVSTLILADYQGLNVKAVNELRSKLRLAGGGFKVVKNTLLNLASVDTPLADLMQDMKGPTAVAFTDGDPVGAAKVLQEYAKGPKSIKVKAGVVDGHVVDAAQVEALAKIPPKEMLYAMVVGGLQAPITGLVGTLQQLTAQLVFTLQGVADKKAAA